ncbi:hypothetical protein KW795_00550 [Candidatus Microgenomates bacterium]|nr:hypothetical protein [Candidatus Microgenomates bacterium]
MSVSERLDLNELKKQIDRSQTARMVLSTTALLVTAEGAMLFNPVAFGIGMGLAAAEAYSWNKTNQKEKLYWQTIDNGITKASPQIRALDPKK